MLIALDWRHLNDPSLQFNAETHTQRSPNPPRQLLSANATAALVAVHNFTFVQPKTKLALGLQFISLDTKPVERTHTRKKKNILIEKETPNSTNPWNLILVRRLTQHHRVL